MFRRFLRVVLGAVFIMLNLTKCDSSSFIDDARVLEETPVKFLTSTFVQNNEPNTTFPKEHAFEQVDLNYYNAENPQISFNYSKFFNLKEINRLNRPANEIKYLLLEYVDQDAPDLTPENVVYFQNLPRLTIQIFKVDNFTEVNDVFEMIASGVDYEYVKFGQTIYTRAYLPSYTAETAYFLNAGKYLCAMVVHNYPTQLFDAAKNEKLDELLMDVIKSLKFNE